MQSSHIMAILIVADRDDRERAPRQIYRRPAPPSRRRPRSCAHDDAETARLREEMKALKERLAVLERITVEKENSLAREIEQLRDDR